MNLSGYQLKLKNILKSKQLLNNVCSLLREGASSDSLWGFLLFMRKKKGTSLGIADRCIFLYNVMICLQKVQLPDE